MEQGSQTVEVVWICRPSSANKLSHGNGALGFCWSFSDPQMAASHDTAVSDEAGDVCVTITSLIEVCFILEVI